jgi:PilZ domain
MQNATERRSPSCSRIPFEAFVEVGSTEGTFEATAMDVSGGGIHLRTAYLPEIGQALSCRFESGERTIICDGQVVWCNPEDHGGEFGLKFENLDADAEAGLRDLLKSRVSAGAKVRLHIEGLGAPMRARLQSDGNAAEVRAASELGFLKVGKGIELEDAQSGQRRPARIDHVEVAIDENSKVPHLVVGLRYADVPEDVGLSAQAVSPVGSSDERTARTELDEQEASIKDRAKAVIDKVSPAFAKLGATAKATAMSVASKFRKTKDAKNSDDVADTSQDKPRRVTAAPPSRSASSKSASVLAGKVRPRGMVHDIPETKEDQAPSLKSKVVQYKRPLALGGAVLIACGLGTMAMRGSSKDPSATGGASAEPTSITAAAASTASSASLPVVAALPSSAKPSGIVAGSMPASDPLMAQASNDDLGSGATANGKPQPFGQGNVSGGQIMRVKLDGAIARIQGAPQPTGFTVVIPGRKASTTGSALQKLDKRFEQVKVSNEGQGAELNVTFKDGVPPYLVRANKDTLEIVLGKGGGTTSASASEDGHERASGKGGAKKKKAHKKH